MNDGSVSFNGQPPQHRTTYYLGHRPGPAVDYNGRDMMWTESRNYSNRQTRTPAKSALSTVWILCAFTLWGLASFSPTVQANGETSPVPDNIPTDFLDPAQLHWSQLTFNASGNTANLAIQRLTKDATKAVLLPAAQGTAIEPVAETYLRLDFRATQPKDVHTQLWLDPNTASALQRLRLNLDKGDERYRVYRFTREGVYRIRKNPRDGEADKPPAQWTNIKNTFYDYSTLPPDGMVVTEPTALFYIASVTTLSQPGEQFRLVGFFDDRLHFITVRLDGFESISSNFKIRHSDGTNSITGERQALRLAVTSTALDGKDSDLSLIGLKGKLRILVDKELRIPLELRGKIKALFSRKVTVPLQEVQLLTPP